MKQTTLQSRHQIPTTIRNLERKHARTDFNIAEVRPGLVAWRKAAHEFDDSLDTDQEQTNEATLFCMQDAFAASDSSRKQTSQPEAFASLLRYLSKDASA